LDLQALYRRTDYYVDKLLRDARPSDLPLEAVFELVVNMRTGRLLGLSVSPAVLLRADRVIE
jgi:putative ABC transport system substrate-binding protein